ncbi:hypothetical protein OUZ56_008424 [Daphnia magna]|uniref:Uncharacterized protein n=1 Tax=Daphnia magna TaxID=35525 RepID=A0ABR0ACX0_9CRUS|nr:hypothetical protein OUZ56_008424 [Daphnia magna]
MCACVCGLCSAASCALIKQAERSADKQANGMRLDQCDVLAATDARKASSPNLKSLQDRLVRVGIAPVVYLNHEKPYNTEHDGIGNMTISYVIIVSYRIEFDNEARALIGIEFELIWERKFCFFPASKLWCNERDLIPGGGKRDHNNYKTREMKQSQTALVAKYRRTKTDPFKDGMRLYDASSLPEIVLAFSFTSQSDPDPLIQLTKRRRRSKYSIESNDEGKSEEHEEAPTPNGIQLLPTFTSNK